MSLGLVGRKVGMTRIFAEDGRTIPVTVLDVADNRVTQIKTPETDGYAAVQVTFGKRRASRVNKPLAGHLAKAGVEAGHVLKEFRVAAERLSELKPGDVIRAEIFAVGQLVDVSGVSIGKGFAGSIKRHNFSSNRESHGNSVTTRAPGSIGMAQDPGRVFPGKRIPWISRGWSPAPYHGSRAMRRSPSPLAWRPDFPGAPSFILERRRSTAAHDDEVAVNPRARSASLRYATRTDAPAWDELEPPALAPRAEAE